MSKNRIPLIHAQYEVYLDGGSNLLGLADVTMPDFTALSETVRGAGIMGEFDVPVRGQFGPLTLAMNFRVLYGDINNVGVTMKHHFDLRSAIETEDRTSYERVHGRERFSVIGIVSGVNYGTRGVAAAAGATVSAAVRRVEHFIDGRQVLEFDPLNNIYKVGGIDIYAPVRAALM
jgi:P2 family phage contractile tail tube protein